jgi:hypothetical protein
MRASACHRCRAEANRDTSPCLQWAQASFAPKAGTTDSRDSRSAAVQWNPPHHQLPGDHHAALDSHALSPCPVCACGTVGRMAPRFRAFHDSLLGQRVPSGRATGPRRTVLLKNGCRSENTDRRAPDRSGRGRHDGPLLSPFPDRPLLAGTRCQGDGLGDGSGRHT